MGQFIIKVSIHGNSYTTAQYIKDNIYNYLYKMEMVFVALFVIVKLNK